MATKTSNRTNNRTNRPRRDRGRNGRPKSQRKRLLIPKQPDPKLCPEIKLETTGFWPFRFVDCGKAKLDEATGKRVSNCLHEQITHGPLKTREEAAGEIIRQFTWRCKTILGLDAAPKCDVRMGGPKKNMPIGVVCPATKSADGTKSLAEAKFGIQAQYVFATADDSGKYFEKASELHSQKNSKQPNADEVFATIE